MTFGIYTLGCKVNTYESEVVKNALEKEGYLFQSFNEINDIYIINTCTVTNTSDSKSRKIIHQALKRNKDACIVVMGCFIEANPDYKEDGISIYIGNYHKSDIVKLLNTYFEKKEVITVPLVKDKTVFEDMTIDHFDERTRAFVKIQDGCENFCSYCIIPYVRGKCRSKEEDKVILEITSFVKNGYQEIVLTGIHTGNYGVDIGSSFAKLLKRIVKIPGLKRLRISSIEITELNDDVLEVIKDNEVIVNHLHIPLQSGSDNVLKAMNRKYDLSYFSEKVKKIRAIRPNISLTTDLIVGFKTETREDFEQTLKTLNELEFTKIHVFPYSERNGTKASLMPNIVSDEEKKNRAKRTLLTSICLEKAYYEKQINNRELVLIETSKEGYSYGHTSNFLYVKIEGLFPKESFVEVKLIGLEYPYLIGEDVNN